MNNLTCPKCETLLNPTAIAEGMLWRCDTCAGLAVNVAVLRKYLSVKIVREFWLKATNESVPADRKCPSCAQIFQEFTVGEYNRKVQLDLCKRCQLIWFDRNELEMFPGAEEVHPDTKRYIATPKAGLETPLYYEREPTESIAVLCLEALCVAIRLFLFRR
ncbi:zf-TFIIB domain-containing protein [Planctomycetota bacterium]